MNAPLSLFLVVLLGFVEAVPRYHSSESVLNIPDSASVNIYVIYNPADVDEHVLNYIIAGGGLIGLTAVARLTEIPEISVLVIEGGFWEPDRSADIYDLTHYGRVVEKAIDHKLATDIQAIDNRTQAVHFRTWAGWFDST